MSADPRLTLALGGLASAALEGVQAADRYGQATAHRAVVPSAAVRAEPSMAGRQLDQLLFGEGFDVLATDGTFAFGQAGRDGYVGWVERTALSPAVARPTHRVTALRAYGFSQPDIKSRPIGLYSLGALVSVEGREGRFAHDPRGGWFVERQLSPIGLGFETDPAAVAARFLGAPYLWGGRESPGLDCSGLVQQALYACGRACPRDSDQQATLGAAVERVEELARGDLVFWRGHVGIMLDPATLLHANAHHMAVTAEPLCEVIARAAGPGTDGRPTALRRLD